MTEKTNMAGNSPQGAAAPTEKYKGGRIIFVMKKCPRAHFYAKQAQRTVWMTEEFVTILGKGKTAVEKLQRMVDYYLTQGWDILTDQELLIGMGPTIAILPAADSESEEYLCNKYSMTKEQCRGQAALISSLCTGKEDVRVIRLKGSIRMNLLRLRPKHNLIPTPKRKD